MLSIEEKKSMDTVCTFLEELSHKDEAVLTAAMNANPEEYSRLLVAMAALTDKACSNINKIFEVVAVLDLLSEYDLEVYDVKHTKHEYGSDIQVMHKITGAKDCIEVKTSVTKKKKKYATNWCFAIPVKELKDYRKNECLETLTPLIESVYKKQENGKTLLIARYQTDCIARYPISGPFVALYAVKKVLSAASLVVNLGCVRCNVCEGYHRAQHLQKHSLVLDERIKETGKAFEYRFDYFSDDEWTTILKVCPSQCKKTA